MSHQAQLKCLLLLVGFGWFMGCSNKKSSSDPISSHSSAEASTINDPEPEASLFEDSNRDIWQKPDRVIGLLEPLAGKTVVDLGAASGYFSFRILPKAGKVIAIDIDQKYINFLQRKRAQLPTPLQEKFEVRLAKADDPLLSAGEADAILLVSTYVYIEDRVTYFKRLRHTLSTSGKIVIIEFKKKSIPNGPPDDEKVSLSQVESELRAAGYNDIQTDDQTLDYQYIVTARFSQPANQ